MIKNIKACDENPSQAFFAFIYVSFPRRRESSKSRRIKEYIINKIRVIKIIYNNILITFLLDSRLHGDDTLWIGMYLVNRNVRGDSRCDMINK